jgi:hypothetical protein
VCKTKKIFVQVFIASVSAETKQAHKIFTVCSVELTGKQEYGKCQFWTLGVSGLWGQMPHLHKRMANEEIMYQGSG